MAGNERLVEHYDQDALVERIREGLEALGVSSASAGVDDLAPVDDFHVGGRAATRHFLDQLDLREEHRVLDVGCGIGGASRFAAATYGCRVSGVDLTPAYVEAGNELSSWVGLGEQVRLVVGSALQLPFEDGSIDRAFLLHVGMNIEDKTALAAEVARVLAPGGVFGSYDVMRTGDGTLDFPLPWAGQAEDSAVAPPARYVEALEKAGLQVESVTDRRDFALAFFEQLRTRAASADGPPPLGLHLLMGSEAATKIVNLVRSIKAGRIAPVEVIARRGDAA